MSASGVVYCMDEGAICFSGDLIVKERNGVVLLLFHGEFDQWLLVFKVLEELPCSWVKPQRYHQHRRAEAKINVLDGIQLTVGTEFIHV